MAKANRGGLGRGLNSLLGGASDGIHPGQTSSNPRTQDRERIIYDEREDVVYEATSPGVTGRMMPITPEESVSRETPLVEEQEVDVVEEVIPQDVSRETSEGIFEVDIESVSPNPDQPRTYFDKDDLEELSNSIKREGLIQPILIRENSKDADTRYQIIAGERRWQAAKLAGLQQIPVQVKNVDDEKALELALIENIQRSDLNPIEEAYGYKRLMERNKMTQADIAQAMSKGRSTIANSLRLLELPEDAQQMLFEDKITAGHARAILSIPTKEGREVITNKLKDHPLSVRETEAYARLLANKLEKGAQKREPQPAIYKSVAKTLKDVLQTNVKIRSVRGKNKIEIEFTDEADLQRLFEEIVDDE